MSLPVVIRAGAGAPVDRGGGVRSVHLVTRAAGATEFLSGTTEFDPGASLPMHSHNCEESVVVLEGAAVFEHDEGATPMGEGDATWVPAGVVHRFRNAGDGRLRILWTYGRADATRTLAASGETVAVD